MKSFASLTLWETKNTVAASKPQTVFDLYSIETLLNEEERAIQSVVHDFVASRIKPQIATWFESGELPVRELARELGTLGVLGMHLEGYGCQGTSARAYGLACH